LYGLYIAFSIIFDLLIDLIGFVDIIFMMDNKIMK